MHMEMIPENSTEINIEDKAAGSAAAEPRAADGGGKEKIDRTATRENVEV